jgi:hypothetical protein
VCPLIYQLPRSSGPHHLHTFASRQQSSDKLGPNKNWRKFLMIYYAINARK